jgi:hypothetical protein
MTALHDLLEEAADWIAADRDEVILCETVGGDTATLPDEARQFVDDANDLIARLLEAAQDSLAQPAAQAVPMPESLHPRTAELVRRFSVALAEKLSAAEKKYGYTDKWATPDWMDECRAKLIEHVAKGDPRDVAAYCAFLWHHGERTALDFAQPAAQAVPSDVERDAKRWAAVRASLASESTKKEFDAWGDGRIAAAPEVKP